MLFKSFLDEIEKIAAGPHIIEADAPSVGGKFISRDSFMKRMEARPDKESNPWRVSQQAR